MDISPSTHFSFITHTGEEFEGVGREAYRHIIQLITKEPAGTIAPVFFENSQTHRRNPGLAGTLKYKCCKRPKRVIPRRGFKETGYDNKDWRNARYT